MTTVTVNTVEELEQLAAEMLHIMVNMRHAQNYWQEHYGSLAKRRKDHWQQKADDLLSRFGVEAHKNTDSIQVMANDQK